MNEVFYENVTCTARNDIVNQHTNNALTIVYRPKKAKKGVDEMYGNLRSKIFEFK